MSTDPAAQMFWDKDRFDKMELKQPKMRPATSSEVEYLASRHAYLELVCFERDESATPEEDLESGAYGSPAVASDPMGWMLQYWPAQEDGVPSIIGISLAKGWPGLTMPEKLSYLSERPGEDRAGTILKQSFSAVFYALMIANVHGWKEVQVADGSDDMRSLSWCVGQALGINVVGYDPTPKDQSRKERIQSLLESKAEAPSPSMNLSPGGSSATKEDAED